MYYDGLEGTENINTSVLIEYGHNSANDQSRVLNLHGNPTGTSATWSTPTPSDGGANPSGDPTSEKLLPAAAGQQRDVQRRRPVLLGQHLPARRPHPRQRRHRLLQRARRPGGHRQLRRQRARGPQADPHLRPEDQDLVADRLDALRPLVPDRSSRCRRRQGVHRERRHQAAQARLPRPPGRLADQRQADRDLRPGHRQVDDNAEHAPTSRCRCSRGCTCCPTARSSTTPPGRRSTRSASPTTRRSGTSRRSTTRRARPGSTRRSPASRTSRRRSIDPPATSATRARRRAASRAAATRRRSAGSAARPSR